MPPPPASPIAWHLPEEGPEAFRYLGIFFVKGATTNVLPTSPVADQLVIGRLFGPNATTDDDHHAYVEQRYLGFFDYTPTLLDGRASLKAGFEIDFTFGDLSNATRGNAGGAINGDTVNLQTKRLLADVALTDSLRLVVGLQPLADSAYDPTRVTPDVLLQGGTHLMFWGTDAAGINLFGQWHRRASARLGYFNLYTNRFDRDDDVHLFMLDGEIGVAPRTQVGLHAWWLRDRGRDRVSGIADAGFGPGTPLAQGNGGLPLDLDGGRYTADLFWVGLDASYDRGLAGGPFTASGFIMANFGTFEVFGPADEPTWDDTPPDLFGLLADVQLAWRYGRTDGDAIHLEALYATGDDTPGDRTLSSVVTGNDYAFPGALHATHRSLLLFPDARVVNRQTAVVYDPANLGHGVMAAFLNASVDVLPHLLNLKLGTAFAAAAAVPAGDDRIIGLEGNAELVWRLMPFLWTGAHGAYVRLGKFLEDRVSERPLPAGNPWTAYLSLTWVHF